MQTQLGFSDNVFGTAFGFSFLGYFFFQVPSNLVLARVGARRWIAVIMVAWGIVSCCHGSGQHPAGNSMFCGFSWVRPKRDFSPA